MSRAVLLRLTLVCALAAGLAACGRKGPLDLPPTAAATAAAPAEQPAAGPLTPPIGDFGRPASPPTPPRPNKPFVLDPLLN